MLHPSIPNLLKDRQPSLARTEGMLMNVFSLDAARLYRELDRIRRDYLAAGWTLDEFAGMFEDPDEMHRPWMEWLRADPI